MTGTIFDIKHFAVHDGPGIRTTVFLKGCPLRCWWCHNPEGLLPHPQEISKEINLDGLAYKKTETIGHSISVDELINELVKDQTFYEQSTGGVTFSGGEPLSQADFLKASLRACKEKGWHTLVDTSGYADQTTLESILPFTDLFYFDLKLMHSTLHKKYTGVDNHQILSSLNFLIEEDANVLVRFPVVPDITNTKENVESIAAFLNEKKAIEEIHILPYHNMASEKYKRCGLENKSQNISKNDGLSIEEIQFRFERIGLKVMVGG